MDRLIRPGLYCYDRRARRLRQIAPVPEREAQSWVRALRAETQRDRELPYYPGQIGRESERVQPDGFLIYPVPSWIVGWRPPEQTERGREPESQGVLFCPEDATRPLSPRSQTLVRLRDLVRDAIEKAPPTNDHEYLIVCYGADRRTDPEPTGENDGTDQTVLVFADERAHLRSGSPRRRAAARRAPARSRRVW